LPSETLPANKNPAESTYVWKTAVKKYKSRKLFCSFFFSIPFKSFILFLFIHLNLSFCLFFFLLGALQNLTKNEVLVPTNQISVNEQKHSLKKNETAIDVKSVKTRIKSYSGKIILFIYAGACIPKFGYMFLPYPSLRLKVLAAAAAAAKPISRDFSSQKQPQLRPPGKNSRRPGYGFYIKNRLKNIFFCKKYFLILPGGLYSGGLYSRFLGNPKM
jgi:hypothetical protein